MTIEELLAQAVKLLNDAAIYVPISNDLNTEIDDFLTQVHEFNNNLHI